MSIPTPHRCIAVPDRTWYDPVLDARLSTGADAVDAVARFVAFCPAGAPIATDIETPGLDNSFVINCVTAAWHWPDGKTAAVLLDPARVPAHGQAVRNLYAHAGPIILHNAAFDVPPLHHNGLLSLDQINAVVDTLLLARMAYPDVMTRKNLETLATAHLGMADLKGGMELAFKAAGFRTITAGYEGMDIDSPVYRFGAMADTVATLRLEPILRATCIKHNLDHPFSEYGATTTEAAAELITHQETVNRVMLRRSAVGLLVDTDYLNRYAEQVDVERNLAIAELAVHGLEGGAGKAKALLAYLDSRGELPGSWPRTRTGQLSATKDDLESLHHPLADAQRKLATIDKVMGYLNKVSQQAAITGRCHPQVGVLGASATGRMSYALPEIQQFPAEARPILCAEGGLTSIDWSQIEPVTMGCMAKDTAFLAPYERGDDLYEPIQRACGFTMDKPGRDLAKVILLATMYGQGVRSLSARIGHTEESAAQIRRQMLSAMKRCEAWMNKVQFEIAGVYGMVCTAAGRILPVDEGGIFKSVNYVVQGSAYDVLAHAIVEMQRQGLADHLQLAMHDELVVDTEAAEAVQHIMATPPPFLAKWLGREPILRTDRADMTRSWAKV